MDAETLEEAAEMKCAGEETLNRLIRLAVELARGKPVSALYIRERYGVSRATSQRDMVRLERALPVKRQKECGNAPSILEMK